MTVRTFLVLMIGFGLGLSVATWRAANADRSELSTSSSQVSWQGARLFSEVMERIKKEYVDPVSDEQLIESAIDGMVSDLDPHSVFLTSESYREVQINTTGNYAGIGVELNTQNNAIVVVAPIDDSPAARAGIAAGDKIIMVDNVPVNSERIEDTLTQMRGEIGSPVLISVTRNSVDEVLNFELIRESINLKSVRGRLLEPGIGYIRVSQFSETTARDVTAQLIKLENANSGNLQGLVIDLRNNPGGVLDAAISVSDAFLENGVIVTADGRTDTSDFSFSAHPGDISEGAGIVVLVNAGSASASEIVAGALQDHGRALVLGEKTFGKGSVQTVLPLSDGQAVKLTTSRYFTPSGQSIHGSGIRPDMEIRPADSADEQIDNQLQGAIDHLRSSWLQSQNH